MAQQFKASPIRSSRRSGGGSGANTLLAYMMAQKKGQQLQEQLGPGAVVIRGTHPSGATFETPEGQAMNIETAGRQKAVTDATTAIGGFQRLLPVIDEFESDFNRLFPNAKSQSGMGGRLTTAKEVFNAKNLQNDPTFAAALDQLEGKRALITKGLGEVGNLAEQEQAIAMQNLPKFKPGGIGSFFLPDAPATGAVKLERFRNFVNSQISKNMSIIESGGQFNASPIPGSPGYQQPQQQQSNDGGLNQERQTALNAINAGAPEDKVRQRFRARTGVDL